MVTVVYREATAYEEDRRARRLSRLATVIWPICPSTTLAPTRIGLDLPCLAPSLDYSTVYVHFQPSWILTQLNSGLLALLNYILTLALTN